MTRAAAGLTLGLALACGGGVAPPGARVVVEGEYPGASPSDVEELVLNPLEVALLGVPGAVEVRSTAREGRAELTVTLEPGVDAYLGQMAVREALEGVMLPADADAPLLRIASDVEPLVLVVSQERGEDVREALLRTPGVIGVAVAGALRERTVVEVDPAVLSARGVTVTELLGAAPDGTLGTGQGDVLLRTVEAVDPASWVVRPGLRLSDLATVRVERTPAVRVEQGGEAAALLRVGLHDRTPEAVLADLGEPAQRLHPANVLELEGPIGDDLVLAGRRYAAALPGAPVLEVDGAVARVWSSDGPVPAGVVEAITLPGVVVHRRTGASVELVLAGPDGARLDEAAFTRFARDVAALPGVVDVRIPDTTASELRVEVNRETAASLGVAPSDVARVFHLLEGVEQRGVTWRWAGARDPLDLPVPGPRGTVPLAALASISTASGEPAIDHLDGRRVQVLGVEHLPDAEVPVETLEIPEGWTLSVR